jgi:hypothetical protein
VFEKKPTALKKENNPLWKKIYDKKLIRDCGFLVLCTLKGV